MNTNQLKNFAKNARIKLIDQISRKLEYVQNNKSQSFLDTYPVELRSLEDKIRKIGKDQVIEMVAYTWFNRLMALRFMDANGYTTPKVLTPLQGMSNPEILQNALAGHIEANLQFDRNRLNDLLDGKTAVVDAQTEVYKMLLVAACNSWHTAMPFMFEHISDYTELLLPDDLLSDYSIIADIRNGMSDKDCKEEEVIGWLYQFYIADKKDEVSLIAAVQKISSNNIPAATQLFTPSWIVRYMVENTLGKLWLTFKPTSKLKQYMPYYIDNKSINEQVELPKDINGITDITFLDPCQGSGHVLVYAFELLTKIYEEEGYDNSEIPELILKNNLFGIDIDERAAQLAAFALSMKARSYYNRFLRKPIQPQVIALENVSEDTIQQAINLPLVIKGKKVEKYTDLSLNLLTQADNFGSLIQIKAEEIDAIRIQIGSIWQEQQEKLKYQANFLSRTYHCVVTNPPYMGSRYMNTTLKEWVRLEYPEGSGDLFAAFMIRCKVFTNEYSYTGLITLHGWMFISTFSDLRKWLLKNCNFNSLVHIGGNSFPSMNSQIARAVSFILSSKNEKDTLPTLCFDLDSVKNSHSVDKEELFNKKIEEEDLIVNVFDKFNEVQSNTFLYSLSNNLLDIFIKNKTLGEIAKPRQGLATGNNARFVRYWHEVSYNKLSVSENNIVAKWFPYNKGGDFRKWYGNNQFIVDWVENGFGIKNNFDEKGKLKSRPQNSAFYFKEGITYSLIGNSSFCARKYGTGHLFDVIGSGFFSDKEIEYLLLGLVNSSIGTYLLTKLNPTIAFQVGDICNIPIVVPEINQKNNIETIVLNNIDIAKRETSFFEENYEHTSNSLINKNTKQNNLSQVCNLKISDIHNEVEQLFVNETKLNSIFSNIYNVKNNENIDNTISINLYGLRKFKEKVIFSNNSDLLYDLIINLLSYSVGCIFGRYSLDKPGLLLANQGDTLQDFLKQVPNPSFLPDDDNIIPVLDDEWFADDIVGRFKVFLKVAFGEENFEENLNFIEDTLGKDIRKYLVKDLYNDHIKRYKKCPIYWMFSSPKGHFKAMIYMHRYQPDLCSKMLNDYLQAFISKLEAAKETHNRLSLREDISAREKTLAIKEVDKLEAMIKDCKIYEKTLFNTATQKISIDLDDGVKVNYLKFKEVIVPIKGLEKDEK